MLVPSGVTLQEYNNAIALENIVHARVTFIIDNIVFQDDELENGGIVLSTYMNPDENMRFGIAYCTEAIIHLMRSDKTDNVNFSHEFTIEFGTEINGEIEWVTVGHFVGEKPVEDITSNTMELIAHDKMKRLDREAKDFISLLNFPCTIGDIYNELCDFVVLDHVAGDENENIMNRQISNANNFKFNTCRDILASIAEANGCYAKMTNDGYVQLVWFEDHQEDQAFTLDNCFQGQVIKLNKTFSKKWGTIEDRKWKDVETVKYSEFDNSNNPFKYSYMRGLWTDMAEKDVIQPAYDPYNRYKLWADVENYTWQNVETLKYKDLAEDDDGTAGSIYTITENPFLLYNMDEDIKTHLQYILDHVGTFSIHYVASVTMVGNWLIEPGDVVQLEIMDNVFTEYPIFNRILQWNGSCQCAYETTGKLTA